MADHAGYTVSGPAEDGYTFEIDFPENVPWEEDERIDQLAELL